MSIRSRTFAVLLTIWMPLVTYSMENEIEPELDEIPDTLFSPWTHAFTLSASLGFTVTAALRRF